MELDHRIPGKRAIIQSTLGHTSMHKSKKMRSNV